MKVNTSPLNSQEVVPSGAHKRPYELRTRDRPKYDYFFEKMSVQPCSIPKNFRRPYTIWPKDQRIQDIVHDSITISLEENKWIQSINDFQNVISEKHVPNSLVVQQFDNNLGKGVFVNCASPPVKKGEFIGIYSGVVRVIPEDQRDSLYAFSVADDIVVDAQRTGNFTRFINHGNAKNANVSPQLMQTAHHNAQIVLIATKGIRPGCQLLMNYGFSYWKDQKIMPFPLTPQKIQIVPVEELAPLAKKQK